MANSIARSLSLSFWDAFKQSTILQGSLSIMIWGVVCYMVVGGLPVPELLASAAYTILGFWFGSKVGQGSPQTAALMAQYEMLVRQYEALQRAYETAQDQRAVVNAQRN